MSTTIDPEPYSVGVSMKRKEDQRFIQGHGNYVDDHSIPGMLMTSYVLLGNNPHPSEAEIRDGLSGNLCRCTGYQNIVKAVEQAAATIAAEAAAPVPEPVAS